MASSQRVQILSGQANELAILGEFIKNPKLIEDLTEEVKKLNALTASEEQKAKEAREYISKHVVLAEDIEKKNAALCAERESHERHVAEFSDRLSAVEKMHADAKAKEDNALLISKKNEKSQAALEEYRAKLDRQNSQERDKLALDLTAIKKTAVENEMEAGRLKRFEEKLKEKADRIKGLMSE